MIIENIFNLLHPNGKTLPQCHVIFKIFCIYNYMSNFHTICLKGKDCVKFNSN